MEDVLNPAWENVMMKFTKEELYEMLKQSSGKPFPQLMPLAKIGKLYIANLIRSYELAKLFNARYSKGSKVKWRGFPDVCHLDYETRSQAFVSNGGAVVHLKGILPAVSIDPQFIKY
jgi:hypothetical protein